MKKIDNRGWGYRMMILLMSILVIFLFIAVFYIYTFYGKIKNHSSANKNNIYIGEVI